MDRRHLLALVGAGSLTAAASLAAPAQAARSTRVLVAANEPWGTYHLKPLLDELAAARPAGRWEAAQVVPDRSQLTPGDPVPAVTLAEASAWGADVLVVTGATDWPVQVAAALPELPIVASSLAYLTPVEAPGAAALRPRLVALTAGAEAEAEVFAAHLGVAVDRVEVVGSPALDDVPEYAPQPGTVLIATSVTRESATGAAAPGSAVLLEAAHRLADSGKRVRVGLHPREDASLWSRFEIAAEGTTTASATAEVTIGIPGSVFPPIAAIGCPLVGVVADQLQVPDYILALCRQTRTAEETVAAASSRWRPSQAELLRAIGPVGGAGRRLLRTWEWAGVPGRLRRTQARERAAERVAVRRS